MALEHAQPGSVVNLHTYANQARDKIANALVKTDEFEAVLMHLKAGHEIAPHAVDGPLIAHCLSGAVDIPVGDESRIMRSGDWMYLEGGSSHSVHALEDSQLLVTILFNKRT